MVTKAAASPQPHATTRCTSKQYPTTIRHNSTPQQYTTYSSNTKPSLYPAVYNKNVTATSLYLPISIHNRQLNVWLKQMSRRCAFIVAFEHLVREFIELSASKCFKKCFYVDSIRIYSIEATVHHIIAPPPPKKPSLHISSPTAAPPKHHHQNTTTKTPPPQPIFQPSTPPLSEGASPPSAPKLIQDPIFRISCSKYTPKDTRAKRGQNGPS